MAIDSENERRHFINISPVPGEEDNTALKRKHYLGLYNLDTNMSSALYTTKTRKTFITE